MAPIAEKVIAVTGAASGIGYAIAHHIASLGARVAITDISIEGLKSAKNELEIIAGRDRVFSCVADIRDRGAVDAWISDIVSTFGRLDGAVNTAGVHPKESGKVPIWEVTDDDFAFAQQVNVQGTLNPVRAQLSYMVGAVDRHELVTGSVLVFGSIGSVTGAPNIAAYVTSKHAVLGLMRAAAIDAAPKNIRVNAICPGHIDTPMLRTTVPEEQLREMPASVPLKRLGSAAEVAGLVTYLLSDEGGYCTGGVYMIDGGMTCA
ncbi:unnamed protein product [Alternaria alternata]